MTVKKVFIGDVHGLFQRYETLVKASPFPTIQVGDMGAGFRIGGEGPRRGEFHQNPPYDVMVKYGAKWIRGNHDNPGYSRRHTQWIPDGHVEGSVMYVGGAWSIDAAFRTEGFSWWADEELSAQQLKEISKIYERVKPKMMVTHDCPEEVAGIMLAQTPGPFGSTIWPTRTGQAFQCMWNVHQPEIWVFGHYHMSFDHVLRGGREKGTRFICLNELEVKILEIPE